MSNLTSSDEKHTKQLGADSVAGFESPDPAIIKYKGDAVESSEAAVHEVIDHVCQIVSEVCLAIEPDKSHIIGAPSPTLNVPQSSRSASIKRDSVEAADESLNCRDSSDSEPSQFNEPVRLSIAQEQQSPDADEGSLSLTVDADPRSPPAAAYVALLQHDDSNQTSQDHERIKSDYQSQSHSLTKEIKGLSDSSNNLERNAGHQAETAQESNLSTKSLIEQIRDAHPPAPQESSNASNDMVGCVSKEENASMQIAGLKEAKGDSIDQSLAEERLPINKSNDLVEPVLVVKPTSSYDKPDSADQPTKFPQAQNLTVGENVLLDSVEEEIKQSEIALNNRLVTEEQHIFATDPAETRDHLIDPAQESVCERDSDSPRQTSTEETKLFPTLSEHSCDDNQELQATTSGGTDNELKTFYLEELPSAVPIVEDYHSSNSNSPDLKIKQDVPALVEQQSRHELQHCEVQESSQKSDNIQTEEHQAQSGDTVQHAQMEIDSQKSPETSESEADFQEATLTVDHSSENEAKRVEPTNLVEICPANNSQLASESANDSRSESNACLGETECTEVRGSDVKASEKPMGSPSPVDSIIENRTQDFITESDNTLTDVNQLLSDLCSKVESDLQEVASEDGEDLMSELHGAKHVPSAAAEGEADDDYMSELCGDGQLAKAVTSPIDDPETDLMTELSGCGNQITNVITVSEESGDEDDTESKLVLCTSTATGQAGSADIEVEATTIVGEVSSEVVSSGSVTLPSTSTPTLSEAKSVAPVAATMMSNTADALANIKAMAALVSGSSSDELATLKRRLEQLEAENKMLKESIQPASTDAATAAPAAAAATLTANTGAATSTSGTAGSGAQHPQADSSGSPQSFSSYDSSSQNYIPAGGFLKSLSEIEESGGACADASASATSTTPQQQQATLDSGAAVVAAAAAVPASTIATAAIQGPVCSIGGGASTAAGSIPATITPGGQIQFILPPGVLPSSFAGLTAMPTVQPSLPSTVPLSVTAATSIVTTTATTSTAKLATPLKSAPTPSKLSQSASASASTPSNRRIRTIAPKPIAMRPILPSPKTDMSTKLPPIQLSNKNASATSASATSGKKSKASTAASKKPTQTVAASSTAMHAGVPAGMPMAMQLPAAALAAVSQSKSLPVVVGTPIGMCASMAPLLAGAGIPMPVNHSSGTAVWATAPPGATFATTWAPTAPTAVVFSTGQSLSAGSLEGTALPSHDLLAIACQEAGLSLDLDLGSTVMISTSQDSATPMIEGVGCDQQSATVTDLGGLVVDAQQESSFLHELGLIQPPQEDGVEQQTPVEVSHPTESVIHCQQPQQQLPQDQAVQQQQQQQQCWNTTTFDDFNAALNDFNSEAVATTSAPTQPTPASKSTHAAGRTPAKSATTKKADAPSGVASSAASASGQLSVSTESTVTPSNTTAPAMSPAKKSHHKSKTTPPIPSTSGSSSTNQPTVSSSATTAEVSPITSGKQQPAQAQKNTPKKKSQPQQASMPEATAVATPQQQKRGGTSKKTTPAKDREAKASSSTAKQQSDIGDDVELFKEIIPPKTAVHKLSENDEIEEAVKGIVGFSSLEDTISGVLKAGEAADNATPAETAEVDEFYKLSSPTKVSDHQLAVPTPPSQAPPPTSSLSMAEPTLQQLAELAAAGDSCPVVSIPESAGLPFGDISDLTTAAVSAPVGQFVSTASPVTKSTTESPSVNATKEEDRLSSKKKSHEGKKSTTSAAQQDSSAATVTSPGSHNKRKSTECMPPGPLSKEKLASDDKQHFRITSESASKEIAKGKEKSALLEPTKKLKALSDFGSMSNDSRSKEEATTAKLDQQQKASSRSALHRSKQAPSDKSALPATSSSSRSESSERKQKLARESSSKKNAAESGPESAVTRLVKVSGNSKSIEDLTPITVSSKSKL